MDKKLVAAKSMIPATLLAGGIVLFEMGVSNEGLRQALRATARVSLPLFALVYLASPLHRLWPSDFSRWILRHRATLGVCFGLSISVHIVLILSLFIHDSGTIPAGITDADFLIGLPGLVLVAAMVVTSAQTIRRAMPARAWAALHRTGLHLVWFIYTACLIDSFSHKSPPYPSWQVSMDT